MKNNAAYQSKADLSKALMHPARLAILDVLRDDEHCVCHIEAALGYRQAYISQQLTVLREAGLVDDRRDGWNIYYRVIQPDIFGVLDAMNAFLGLDCNAEWQQKNSKRVCPCPKCNPAVEGS